MPRDELQAAYFALLRAREELEGLRRYGEYLEAERRRLDRSEQARRQLTEGVDDRLLRALRYSDEALGKAVEARRRVVADELRRLPDRLAAAEEFVAESERAHEELRRSA